MTLFWIMWSFAALVGLGVFCCFLITLGTDSVHRLDLWLVMLAAIAIVLLGSLGLAKNGYPGLAKVLLLLLVTPGLISMAMGLGTALLGRRR